MKCLSPSAAVESRVKKQKSARTLMSKKISRPISNKIIKKKKNRLMALLPPKSVSPSSTAFPISTPLQNQFTQVHKTTNRQNLPKKAHLLAKATANPLFRNQPMQHKARQKIKAMYPPIRMPIQTPSSKVKLRHRTAKVRTTAASTTRTASSTSSIKTTSSTRTTAIAISSKKNLSMTLQHSRLQVPKLF